MQLGEAINAFTLARSPRWSKATRRNYRQRLAILGNYFGLERDVTTVTKRELQQWVLTLMDQNVRHAENAYRHTEVGELSPSTVNTYVQAAMAFFGWCADPEQGLGMQNPAVKLEKPKIPDQDPKAIEDKDAERLLEFVDGNNPERDLAILMMLRCTGGRVGGLASLTVANLFLEEGRAKVTEKGKKLRTLYLTEDAIEALQRWLEVRPTVKHDFVFVSENGQPMKTGTIAQMLKRRKRDAGIQGRVNPHSWRHGAAKTWIKNGADLATTSALLGHSDSRVTTKFYLRFTADELAERHAKFTPPTRETKRQSVEKRDLLSEPEQYTAGKKEKSFLRRVK